MSRKVIVCSTAYGLLMALPFKYAIYEAHPP
jgi:hypothetical protein